MRTFIALVGLVGVATLSLDGRDLDGPWPSIAWPSIPVAHAAEWDTVRPGESTQDAVRTQLGAPSKVASQRIEGYDGAQWIYEGDQAPRGMTRATVDFGLLTPQGYRADLVRVLRLEPRPGAFNRGTVIMGWGPPQRIGREKDVDVFFYEAGLLVYFNKDGDMALLMVFTPRQPPAAGGATPTR